MNKRTVPTSIRKSWQIQQPELSDINNELSSMINLIDIFKTNPEILQCIVSFCDFQMCLSFASLSKYFRQIHVRRILKKQFRQILIKVELRPELHTKFQLNFSKAHKLRNMYCEDDFYKLTNISSNLEAEINQDVDRTFHYLKNNPIKAKKKE